MTRNRKIALIIMGAYGELLETTLQECEADGDTITAAAIHDFSEAANHLVNSLQTRDNAQSILERAANERV